MKAGRMAVWLLATVTAFVPPSAAQSADTPVVPLVTIAEAIGRIGGSGQFVRVRATLLMETGPGYFFVKDGSGTIRGTITDPIPMKPGDMLELTGLPGLNGPANKPRVPWLLRCKAVNLGPGTLPPPVSMRAKE